MDKKYKTLPFVVGQHFLKLHDIKNVSHPDDLAVGLGGLDIQN